MPAEADQTTLHECEACAATMFAGATDCARCGHIPAERQRDRKERPSIWSAVSAGMGGLLGGLLPASWSWGQQFALVVLFATAIYVVSKINLRTST